MLVAHFLRRELERLDLDGRIRGEVILVPAANPIGLSQIVHGAPFGRFDLAPARISTAPSATSPTN
jgi:predicted deacylase